MGLTSYHRSNSTSTLIRYNTACKKKKKKICLLIDIATLHDSNVNTKEAEKPNKYKDLEIKVSRKWTVRTKIVPVIAGSLGTFKKGIDQNLQLLPGNPSATEPQKIVQINTAHIIHKVLG